MSHSGQHRGGPPRGGGPPMNRGSGGGRGRGGGPRPEADAYRVGPLRVVVNCFKITRLPQSKYYHYDVVFEPSLQNWDRAIEIIDHLQNTVEPTIFTPRAVYDGRNNLFAPTRLSFPSNSVSGTFTIGRRTITISPVAEIDCQALQRVIDRQATPSPQSDTANMLLQQLIRAAPSLMATGTGTEIHQRRGIRSYYTDVGKVQIGGGLELWQGLFQSARPSVGSMLINVDTSISAMYRSGPLMDVARDLLNLREANMRDLSTDKNDKNFKKVKSFLKGLWVRVKPTNRRKRIMDIQEEAGLYKFSSDRGTITVEEHFRTAHNIRLSYPRMFGIITGSTERKVVYPFEVCTVEGGQSYKRKIPSEYTAEVVKQATKSPSVRLRTIQNGVGNPNDPLSLKAPALDYQTSPYIRNSGMTVSTSPLELDGRVVQPPDVRFGNQAKVNPSHGAWNFVQNQFIVPAPVAKWAVISYKHDNNIRDAFVNALMGVFKQLGMAYQTPEVRNYSGDDIEADLMRGANPLPGKPNLLIFIVDTNAEDLRRLIKYTCDVKLGILNQCIRFDKIRSMSGENRKFDQYLKNVALKINTRLGGLNSTASSAALARLTKKQSGSAVGELIVGLDVSHPGPGVKNQPSIVGLSYCGDTNAMKYKALMSIQEPRTEIVVDLADMMKRILLDYEKTAKIPPARIIFYRDGVSEGEFSKVANEEIAAIENAVDHCMSHWMQKYGAKDPSKVRPKISFVVVGKRHHIRFFPLNGVGQDRSGNCPAGFLASEGIQSPVTRDFYLQSHGGLLGTSRPAHYTVLHDDNTDQGPEWLQELSFTLCHCYASATRSVSIPAPVYYADRICARGKFHFEQDYSQASVISDENSFDANVWNNRFRAVHQELKDTMYFL